MLARARARRRDRRHRRRRLRRRAGSDGEEFDNSYDRGEPFPVALGTGSVIEGGNRVSSAPSPAAVQLDIPADLAYRGQAPRRADRPGDALTFVVDVRAVVPAVDPAASAGTGVTESDRRDRVTTSTHRGRRPVAGDRTDRRAPLRDLPRRRRGADRQHLGRRAAQLPMRAAGRSPACSKASKA